MSVALAAPAVADHKDEEEKDDNKDDLLMSKEEAKMLMKTKDFEQFINKTSKIIERALETSVDVMGAYFDDDKDD